MLPPAEFDAIAAKVAAFTGLSVEYVKESQAAHRAHPLPQRAAAQRRQILGRYDARFDGFDIDSAGENPGYDPSDTGISGAFIGAFHDYLQTELKYMSSEPYYLSAPGINQNWDWTHRPSGFGGGGGGFGGRGMP
jgi:carboxypeptidase C (cathepsin A)